MTNVKHLLGALTERQARIDWIHLNNELITKLRNQEYVAIDFFSNYS